MVLLYINDLYLFQNKFSQTPTIKFLGSENGVSSIIITRH